MPVELTEPLSAVYPYAWFPQIKIEALDPNADATVHIRVVPFRVRDDGTRELAAGAYEGLAGFAIPPGQVNPVREVLISDLFAQSQFTPEKLAAVQAILDGCNTGELLAIAQQALYAAIAAKGNEMGAI